MELKRTWRSLNLRKMYIALYACVLATYVMVGLTPAEATDYEVATDMQIPAIGLTADVTTVRLKDGELATPDTIVGRYAPMPHKTFLFGHSSTVFTTLSEVKVGDTVIYDETEYVVQEVETLAKSEIDMKKILASAEVETVVVMTCAGEDLGGGDSTHRLIVTATVE